MSILQFVEALLHFVKELSQNSTRQGNWVFAKRWTKELLLLLNITHESVFLIPKEVWIPHAEDTAQCSGLQHCAFSFQEKSSTPLCQVLWSTYLYTSVISVEGMCNEAPKTSLGPGSIILYIYLVIQFQHCLGHLGATDCMVCFKVCLLSQQFSLWSLKLFVQHKIKLISRRG